MSTVVDSVPNPNDARVEVESIGTQSHRSGESGPSTHRDFYTTLYTTPDVLKQESDQPNVEPGGLNESMSTMPGGDTLPNPNDARIEIESIGHQSHRRRKASPETHPEVRKTTDAPEDRPKMWMPGDPYQHALPKPEGDCWSLVLAEKLKSDTIKCDAWKDEVQNLLIFAGLFSAVVTAFVIESYKNLRPDPNDTIIFLLNRIANDGATSAPTFTRSASTIRINICWFLSLILSLATVLVGIVSLQWLREHQKYTDEITHRKSLSVFHMRTQGLDAWHVSRIFTGLPLLLQSALVIFFLGVVDFLFTLDFIVAIPVTAAIALTLLFLIVTTMLPTLQLLIPRKLDPKRRKDKTLIPAQCPYKSPQAWIFYRLSSLIYQALRRFRLSSSTIINKKLTLFPFRFALSAPKDYHFKSWISFDSWWLTIPEVHMTRPDAHSESLPYSWVTEDQMYAPDSLTRVVRMHPSQATLPTYMEAESLIQALKRYSSTYTAVCALYHCFQEVTVSVSNLDDNHQSYANALFELYYIQRTPEIKIANEPFLPYCAPSRLLSTDLSDAEALLVPPHAGIQDEQMIWFLGALWRYGYPQSLKTLFASHAVELISRSTSYLLSKNRVVPVVNRNKYDPGLWHRNQSAFPGTLEHSEFGHSIPKEVLEASVTQFYLIFDVFIHRAAEVTKNASLLGSTYNEPPFLEKFCSIPARLLGPIIRHPTERDLPEIFQQTLHFISSTLDQAISRETPRPLLFLAASYIMTDLLRDFQFLDSDGVNIVTRFRKWNYDPVRSRPILSLMEGLSNYYDHFKTTAGHLASMEPEPSARYPHPFTGGNVYIWHVTPTFDLSRVQLEIPTVAPRLAGPPTTLSGSGHFSFRQPPRGVMSRLLAAVQNGLSTKVNQIRRDQPLDIHFSRSRSSQNSDSDRASTRADTDDS